MQVEIRLAWHRNRGSFGGQRTGESRGGGVFVVGFLGAFENTNSKGAQWFFFNKKKHVFQKKREEVHKKKMSHGIY